MTHTRKQQPFETALSRDNPAKIFMFSGLLSSYDEILLVHCLISKGHGISHPVACNRSAAIAQLNLHRLQITCNGFLHSWLESLGGGRRENGMLALAIYATSCQGKRFTVCPPQDTQQGNVEDCSTPPIRIAICLPFVSLCPPGSTPPICTAVPLLFVLQYPSHLYRGWGFRKVFSTTNQDFA